VLPICVAVTTARFASQPGPVLVAEPPHQSGQTHGAHEAELLKALQASIVDLGVASVHGQGAANKFGVNGWELSPLQQFQYGDAPALLITGHLTGHAAIPLLLVASPSTPAGAALPRRPRPRRSEPVPSGAGRLL
jgi:hypothetical protein